SGLLDRALAVAGQLAAVPSEAFALTKQQLQADVRQRIDARRPEWEARVADLWGGEPVLAAVEAFVARTLRR
ncbi:MAG: enoyl-CoA hydratase/isomerase family protein, partial [Actinomycetota bacterium]|nr:enoyl-CoA hydratase/isomerase family protein [Actinomycetota bacterium]